MHLLTLYQGVCQTLNTELPDVSPTLHRHIVTFTLVSILLQSVIVRSFGIFLEFPALKRTFPDFSLTFIEIARLFLDFWKKNRVP